MNIFLFDRPQYDALYNCSGVDLAKVGKPNVLLGVTYMSVGIVLELLYIPCMRVLWSPHLRQNSCHKVMFLLGFLDMGTLFMNSIIAGYLTIEGAVFCTHPNVIYVVGCFALGFWCATCAISVVLGLNRLIDMWFPDLMVALFKGNRTYLWCCIPFVYGMMFTLLTKPLIYSSNAYAFFFDPLYGIDVPDLVHHVRDNFYHSCHNTATIIATFFIYISLTFSVWWKCRKSHIQTQTVSNVQKQIITQACMICFFNLCAAFVYVYMQYMNTPQWLIVLGQATWIGCHGGAVIVYLCFNKTIRGEVLAMICRKSAYKQNTVFVTTAITQSMTPVRMNYVAYL